MLQIVTEFCLLHLTPSYAGCKYFVLSSEVHAENFSRWYICVCIATAVDFSIQVQMNQWKIVWFPVWIKSEAELLLEVDLYLVKSIFGDNLGICFHISPYKHEVIQMSPTTYVPCHEILVLFVLCKLILQVRMHSHPVAWAGLEPATFCTTAECSYHSTTAFIWRLEESYPTFITKCTISLFHCCYWQKNR